MGGVCGWGCVVQSAAKATLLQPERYKVRQCFVCRCVGVGVGCVCECVWEVKKKGVYGSCVVGCVGVGHEGFERQ